MPQKNIRGVIFDVDGTLVDSNPAHAQAWVKALAGCYQKAFGEAFPLDFHFETEFSPVSILAGRIPRTGLKIRHTL
jgi:beta-phosphoglucomutase-like phosphatase (HAD superfamily)